MNGFLQKEEVVVWPYGLNQNNLSNPKGPYSLRR